MTIGQPDNQTGQMLPRPRASAMHCRLMHSITPRPLGRPLILPPGRLGSSVPQPGSAAPTTPHGRSCTSDPPPAAHHHSQGQPGPRAAHTGQDGVLVTSHAPRPARPSGAAGGVDCRPIRLPQAHDAASRCRPPGEAQPQGPAWPAATDSAAPERCPAAPVPQEPVLTTPEGDKIAQSDAIARYGEGVRVPAGGWRRRWGLAAGQSPPHRQTRPHPLMLMHTAHACRCSWHCGSRERAVPRGCCRRH